MATEDNIYSHNYCMSPNCGALSNLLRCRACVNSIGWGNFWLGWIAGTIFQMFLNWLF